MDLKELVDAVVGKAEEKEEVRQLVVEEYINTIKLPSPRTPKKAEKEENNDTVVENDYQMVTPSKAVFQRHGLKTIIGI